MRIKNLIAICLFIVLAPIVLSGQSKNQLQSPDVAEMMRSSAYENQGAFSLLGINPAKIKFEHSYSVFYSSFSGGNSMTQGMYLNTISYQFSQPLSMKLQWGVLHQPFGGSSGIPNPNLASQFFLSGAELKYKMRENMVFKFQFHQIPGGLYYPPNPNYRNGYSNRMFRNSWWDDWDD